MQLIKGHRTRVWATVSAAACVVVLLMLALWQTVWASEGSEAYEGGDAPAGTNHTGAVMTAYSPGGGPPGTVANFDTVWDAPGLIPGFLSYGFCHSCSSTSFLGAARSCEWDADLLPDQDGVTNIDPPGDIPDLDLFDDGVFFPPALPHCLTSTVTIVGNNGTPGPLYINAWADWNRHGDWNNGSVCGCGDDEWAIQNYSVAAPGLFTKTIDIMPCHPGGDSTNPLWVRVMVSEVSLPITTPWSFGAQPYPAFDPAGGPQGCFAEGETEDYYVEPDEPACDWVKQISINNKYAGDWELGAPDPFGVVVSDTITISDALDCNFWYDWDLWEYWDPDILSWVSHDNSHGSVVTGTGDMHWSGGYPVKVAPGTVVTLTKTLHVEDSEWMETVITETVAFSPEGAVEPITTTVDLVELVEGGDAPSSHNHTWSVMNTYNPAFGGVPANFPVVWDWDGTLGPGPGGGAYPGGYYGLCHWSGANPSFLGNGLTFELDADVPPDQDPWTNINPPADTPNWDGLDDGVIFPKVLPHCGPATLLIQGQNNSGHTLYLNAWADWTRDGDWEDTSLCECQIDEWIIEDYAVPFTGHGVVFNLGIPITSCHPVMNPTEPLWLRVTLDEMHLGAAGPPFWYGGQPSPAPGGCFWEGETEDYFVESFDVCWWDKEVSIDGDGPYAPEEGPFTVVVSNTVTISEALRCTFNYDWDLLEQWDPAALSIEFEDHSHGTVVTSTNDCHWYLPSGTVAGNTVVTLTKELHVDALPGLTSTVISETLDFSPAAMVPTWNRPIVLDPFQSYVPLTMKRY